MNSSVLTRAAAVLALCAVPGLADFTYQQTTRMTGGAMLPMMQMASKFSKEGKKLTEPTLSTVSIKGDRMLNKSADHATIMDLEKETITTLHPNDRTYSVITFEQMRQQMAEAAEKMKSKKAQSAQNTDMSFDVKMNDTGKTKTVNGFEAHETIMEMTMTGTDRKSGDQGGMNVTNDMWMARGVSGYGEVRDFHKKMVEKLGWALGDNPMLNRPDMAKAMAELYKNGGKMEGMPVASTIRMGVTGQPGASTGGSQPAPQTSQADSSGSAPPTSVSSALAGALGGHFGLGKHKKQDSSTSSDAPAASSGSGSSSGTDCACLIEMSNDLTSFNTASVDASAFEVPAGFSKIEENLAGGRKH